MKDAFEQDDKRASVLDAVPVGDAAPSMPSESALEAAQKQKSYDELPSQDNVDESSISQSDMPKLEPKEWKFIQIVCIINFLEDAMSFDISVIHIFRHSDWP